MQKILKASFFNRPAVTVAKELLGKYLVRRYRGRSIACMITEAEAYTGPHDRASHASRGITPRTKVMFGSPGIWYVYFVYGMHWMLNIVTGKQGYPAAVLIRGAVAEGGFTPSRVEGPALSLVEGPARLTAFLRIEKSFSGKRAIPKNGLWIEDRGIVVSGKTIKKSPRIGVEYAGPKWGKAPYRFFINGKTKKMRGVL